MKGIVAIAYISPQNYPILVRACSPQDDAIKYHYIAHTSLDVFEERTGGKAVDPYLGLLYAMDDVAVYGYITAFKVKIVVALALSDTIIKDVDMVTLFKALHMAYYRSISNPFLTINASSPSEKSTYLAVGNPKWKKFRERVDEVVRAASVS